LNVVVSATSLALQNYPGLHETATLMTFSKDLDQDSILEHNVPLVNVTWSGRQHIEKTVCNEQSVLQSMHQFVSQQIVSNQSFP